MEFTNNEEEQAVQVGYQVPQIGHIDYADSVGQLTKQKYGQSYKSPANQQFHTFNRNVGPIRQESPETPS